MPSRRNDNLELRLIACIVKQENSNSVIESFVIGNYMFCNSEAGIDYQLKRVSENEFSVTLYLSSRAGEGERVVIERFLPLSYLIDDYSI